MIKYTRQDCIEALERVAQRLDKSPSQSEYKQHSLDSEPATNTINKKFNGWNQAKKQAGLSSLRKRYTEKECLEAIKRVATELDKNPSQRDYREYRLESEPSKNAITRKFDCWNQAKKQAGLSISKYNSEYTRKECLEALERVATELDKSPSIRDYNQHKLDSEPSGHTIHRLFDDWSIAKQQAGLSSLRKRYTEKECLEALERVAQKLDKIPKQKEYNEHKLDSEPSIETIRIKFDEWNKAKQQAGLSVSKK